MDQPNSTNAQSETPPSEQMNNSPVKPTTQSPQVPLAGDTNQKSPRNLPFFLVVLTIALIFLAGGVFGYIAYAVSDVHQKNVAIEQVSLPQVVPINVPKSAVLIQSCATNKGSLYVEPGNIPDGPVYMSYKGKVIGIEFMLDKNDLLQGQIKKVLKALTVHTDHVRLGFLSEGHEGYTKPHYHVDLYQVDEKTEQAITCPKGTNAMPAESSTTPATSSSSSQLTPSLSSTPSAMKGM